MSTATAPKKTKCPVSREQFKAHAKPITVTIGDRTYSAMPKEFSTGSLGYNVNEKITLEIDGVPVTYQIGLNITAIGSKTIE